LPLSLEKPNPHKNKKKYFPIYSIMIQPLRCLLKSPAKKKGFRKKQIGQKKICSTLTPILQAPPPYHKSPNSHIEIREAFFCGLVGFIG